MAADPSSFDFYRRGQPLNVEKGRPDESGFDYYRRGQPLIGLVSASTYTLTASTGSFALTGNAAGLTVSRVLTASTGAFVFTGNNASLIVSRVLSASTGAFVLTGNDANLTFVGSFILIAQTGIFLFTGNPATLTATNPVPTSDQSGDGFRLSERYKIVDDTQEKENKLLEEEQEGILSMFQMFIISNN